MARGDSVCCKAEKGPLHCVSIHEKDFLGRIKQSFVECFALKRSQEALKKMQRDMLSVKLFVRDAERSMVGRCSERGFVQRCRMER